MKPHCLAQAQSQRTALYIVVSVSECKAWAEELNAGWVLWMIRTKPHRQSYRLCRCRRKMNHKLMTKCGRPRNLCKKDPKDKGNRKIRYQNKKNASFGALCPTGFAIQAGGGDGRDVEGRQTRRALPEAVAKRVEMEPGDENWSWKMMPMRNENLFNDRLIRFPELEKIFGVCKRTVRRKAETGELRHCEKLAASLKCGKPGQSVFSKVESTEQMKGEI